MFGPMAKWVAQIDDAARIPELVSQAFHRAVGGRPGPVVIALPEDMLTDHAEVAKMPAPYKIVQPYPGVADLEAMRELLAMARQPLMILGGGGWTAAAVRRHPRCSPRPTTCRSAPRSAARTCSTTPIPTMPAMSASASTRRWASA